MTTGLTYESFTAAVANLIPTLTADPNLQAILPLAIDYAELRCLRDLDFLAMHGTFDCLNTIVGDPIAGFPSFIIVAETLMYGIQAVGVPLVPTNIVTPASMEFIRSVYTGAPNGPPEYWAPIGASIPNSTAPDPFGSDTVFATHCRVLLGPAPDAVYDIQIYGTARPAPLSADNDSTYLSQTLPDLFFAAAMIFFSGYSKNYGAMGVVDDPQMGMSWSKAYEQIRDSAYVEETRKRFQAPSWSAQQPSKLATPQRQ